MIAFSDEELLRYMAGGETLPVTLAEIHKILIQKDLRCGIEELRQKVRTLHRDGYLGNEPTSDGVNMYYILFSPDETPKDPTPSPGETGENRGRF